jgi:hypothetical protein
MIVSMRRFSLVPSVVDILHRRLRIGLDSAMKEDEKARENVFLRFIYSERGRLQSGRRIFYKKKSLFHK